MDLNKFNTTNVLEATIDLFWQLGIKLNSNTAQTIPVESTLGVHYKDKEPFTNITNLYFAGLIDDSVFQNTLPDNKISLTEAQSKTYTSLMIFALKLDKYPSRAEISEMVRVFNRKRQTQNTPPVALLLRYEDKISLGLPELSIYKQAWRQGEKVGKIIILKDISTKKPHGAHIKILEGLKIGTDVRNYNDLHKYWQKQFSLQSLNEAFYKDLQQWFYFAKNNIILPYKPEYITSDSDNNKNFLVRLLARTMFCWFIKEKGLIPSKLLELKDYQGTCFKLTDDIDNENFLQNNSYYRGILQNVFFKSLNEKEKKSSKDFKWTKYLHVDFDFSWLINIPYLNGGIFDKLEEDNYKESIEDRVIKIPNFLFYGNEEQKGLNEIFNSYKFTLEENTPYEEDIALDPELLGLVFENLLAELDPNLEDSARKSIKKLTGSFYTPRKVVQEMVNESLFIYLKKHITPEQTTMLSDLIFKEEFNVKNEDFCKRIVTAIDKFKMLDPACGSGAFPMGMLHKLVLILAKVDKNNEKWIDLKLQLVDPNYRDEFKRTLVQHRDNYSRKLGIIRDSIYGIDIQPLAVQITKLRFFISLLIDQKDEITPMPNIETKIICADSLKNIEPDLFSNDSIKKLIEARRKYYQPNLLHEEKEKIADEIADELDKVFSLFSKQVTGKSISGQNRELIREWFTHGTLAAPFFNMDFFYPELKEQGFDCVIGNPPYGGTKIDEIVRQALSIESKDPYGAFIARFLAVYNRPTPLKDGGVLAFIVSDTFMTIKSHLKLRKQMMDNYIHKMIRVHPDTFRATVNTAIIICERNCIKEFKSNHICQMVDMTNVSIHENYARFVELLHETEGVSFDTIKESKSNPEYAIYYYMQALIRTNSNLPFFVASPKLFALMNDNGNDLKKKWRDISGKHLWVRKIDMNGKEIEVVNLGDIANVQYGIRTGDNSKFFFQKKTVRGNYRNIEDYKEFLISTNELELVSKNEMLKGISENKKYIVPLDKGGESESEKGWLPNYYVESGYYFDWSEKSVDYLYKIKGMRNPDIHFKQGITFSWAGEYAPTFRKSALGIYDQSSSSIQNFESFFKEEELLSILSSKLQKFIQKSYIDSTVNTDIDVACRLIIILKIKNTISLFVNNIILKQKLDPNYDYASNEQIEIDKLVYEAYGLTPEDVEEAENWYARRYPKLSEAQKKNLRNLGKSDDYLVLYGYKTEER